MNRKYHLTTLLVFVILSGICSSVPLMAQEEIPIDSIQVVKPPASTDSIKPHTPIIEIDSLAVSYFQSSFDNLKLGQLNPYDTTITYFQQYDPLTNHNKLYSTLSNIGLAAKNQVFTPPLSTGYSTTFESFNNYIFTNSDVKYYELNQPFTELFYVMGSKKEQNLQVTFSRELFKDFTFGLQFGLNSSPGPYTNSKSNDSRVYFTTRYQTPNKRYGVLANYLHNKLEMQENGGIVNDSAFELTNESDRRVIAVNLNSAENMVKKSGFYVEQYFNLLKPVNQHDSTSRKIDVGSLSYSVLYERNQSIYQDPSDIHDFYIGHLPPIDSTSTFDSLYQEKISNTLKWSSLGYQENGEDKHFYLYFGITQNHLIQSYAYDSVDNIYNQLIPLAGLGINIGRSFYLNVDAKYVTGDYNGGDYYLSGVLNQFLGRKDKNAGEFSAGLQLINRTPDWYFNKYNSNHYQWNNTLKKEQYSIMNASYSYRDLILGGKFYTVVNHTYFSDSMQPTQIEKGESVLQLFIEGTIPWKSVGLNARVVYQETSQPNVIRVPRFTGTMDLYFKRLIFKEAATLKTGFQVTYFSSYFADAYMPELRVFYLQNEKKIGNYPYVDFYVTLVVKRARLFFKWAHLNGYLGDFQYYSSPHYPTRDARLYFGVSWRFHD